MKHTTFIKEVIKIDVTEKTSIIVIDPTCTQAFENVLPNLLSAIV